MKSKAMASARAAGRDRSRSRRRGHRQRVTSSSSYSYYSHDHRDRSRSRRRGRRRQRHASSTSSYLSRSSSSSPRSEYKKKVQKKVVDKKVDTKVGTKLGTKVEKKGDKKVETKLEKKLEKTSEKKLEKKVETKVKKVETTKVKKVEKKVQKGVEIKVETKVQKRIEKKVETKVGKKADKKPLKDAQKSDQIKVQDPPAVVTEKPKAELEAEKPKSPEVVKTPPSSPYADQAQPLANVKELMQDTANLQLMILQAKQDLADRRDTQQRQERREKEYFRPSFGDPVGPNNRLLLEEELGQGAFSTVFRARDLQAKREDRHYAVKFIRKNPTLRTAMEREVKLMRRLRLEASEKDPEGASCFLGLAGPEVFEHEGHLALCFQLQKCDLRCGLKRYGQGAGLPLPTVRSYARNIFMALRALKAVNVIHSDLKPDNLLMSLDKVSVKLSDFGCAMNSSELIKPEKAAETVQPRYYRAPEVILGQEYSTQVDIWGAGCTVFELATGNFLFTGRNNTEMLHDIMKHLGVFSRNFCGAGVLASKHFRREDGAFCLGAEQFVGRENFPRPARPLCDRLQDLNASPVALKAFAELIVSCVTPDPAVRTDAVGALASQFLRPNTKP